MPTFSLLDLSPVPEGKTPADALANTLDLARAAERWGYHRFWLAEHHNMRGIASAATSVVIGHVAAGTESIRVGAGGVMLPNHAPLVIAEHFGTLATLYPGRIDLGLGRAPGTDRETMVALRRDGSEGERFPHDVVELLSYLGEPKSGARIRAVPGTGTNVPVWILGSSTFGAQLAAHLGLPYAFASHFAPAALEVALGIYRERFEPSPYLAEPRFMLAVNGCAADTDDRARVLRSSMQLAVANLRLGQPGPLPRPVENIDEVLGEALVAAIDSALSVTAAGSPTTVARQLDALIERYRPDELILTGLIHDQQARLRSFEIAAEVLRARE
jgi:luciferase family oxidoreductase group 1